MKVHVRKGILAEAMTEAAVIALFEGDAGLGDVAAKLDKKSGGLIAEIVGRGDFTGRLNEVAVMYPREELPTKRLVLVGLGKRVDISLERLRGAFSKAAQHIRSLKVSEFSTAVDFKMVNLPLDQSQMSSRGSLKLGVTEMKGSWFAFDDFRAHEDWCRWRAPFWHGTRVLDPKSHANYHLGFRCCKSLGPR